VSGVLENLARRYGLVAVVSGRPASEVRDLLQPGSVAVFGLYGLESEPDRAGGVEPAPIRAALADVEGLARSVQGARVEDKGRSLAVHYREAGDPAGAVRRLRPKLEALARRRGLGVIEGKMVIEVVPLDLPGKGAVVAREAASRGLRACLFAGDDVADLDAFSELDRLRGGGLLAAKVAVRGPETPVALIATADVVVEGPQGLLELLRALG
jgi:trehalose 6-phosphate phosphatase